MVYERVFPSSFLVFFRLLFSFCVAEGYFSFIFSFIFFSFWLAKWGLRRSTATGPRRAMEEAVA